uniref:Uncharacterized protein n=1 Tax=Arundo donax TaxID=35708 RepID=A0A0A9DD68_ARUDO
MKVTPPHWACGVSLHGIRQSDPILPHFPPPRDLFLIAPPPQRA